MMPRSGTPTPNAIGCERPHTDQREHQHDRLEQCIHSAKREQHGGNRIADACRSDVGFNLRRERGRGVGQHEDADREGRRD
jgi:hypothetical protein